MTAPYLPVVWDPPDLPALGFDDAADLLRRRLNQALGDVADAELPEPWGNRLMSLIAQSRDLLDVMVERR